MTVRENKMTQLQKFGGLAALIDAATFIVGFALYFSLLAASNYENLSIDAVQHAAFLTENQGIMYAWNFIIYVVFGIFLVVLSLALHDRLKEGSAALSQVALAFGQVWSLQVAWLPILVRVWLQRFMHRTLSRLAQLG